MPKSSIVDKIMGGIWLVACVLQALTANGKYTNVYDLPKLLNLGVFALLLSVIFLAFKKSLEISRSTLVFGVSLFLVMVVNLLTSVNPERSFWGDRVLNDTFLAFLLYLPIFMYVAFGFINQQLLLKGVVLMGLLIAVGGLIHAYALYILELDILSYDGRITGTIGQANMLGGLMAGILPVALMLLVKTHRKSAKVVYLISMVLMFACLVLSMSRGAYLATFIIGVAEIVRRLKRVRYKVAFVLVLVSLISSVFLVPKKLVLRNQNPYLLRRFFSFRAGSGLSDIRFEIWNNSLPIILARSLVGWGNGNYQEQYQRFLVPSRSPQTTFSEVESSHNIFIDMAVEFGLLITLFTLFGLIFILVKSRANIYIKYGLVALVIRNLISITSGTIWLLTFVYLGLLLKDTGAKRYIVKGFTAKLVLAGLTTVSMVTFLAFGRIAKSDQLEKRIDSEGSKDKVAKLYQEAMRYNSHKESLWGKYVGFLVWAGDGLGVDTADTLKNYRNKFDDYRANYYSGLYYLKTGDTDKSVKYFTRAYELNKRDPKTSHYLALQLYKQNQIDKAYTMFLYTVTLDKKNFNDDYMYLCEIMYKKGDLKAARKFMELAPKSQMKDRYEVILSDK